MAKLIIESNEHYKHLVFGTTKRIQGFLLNVWSRSENKKEGRPKPTLEIKCEQIRTGDGLRDFVFANYRHVVI
jgi:hypothetical protein